MLSRQRFQRVTAPHTSIRRENGGRVVLNSNKPADKIDEIFDESRTYYVLAITRDPVESGADKRHQVRIAVNRNDATVRARNLDYAADT